MSEERLARIEAALARLATKADLAEMATKADLAALRAEMATKAELAELRAEMATKADLAELRAEMATKADLAGLATKDELAAAIAGVARNVEIEALARLVRQSLNETAALRDELRVVSAFVQQLVGAVSGMTNLLSRLVEPQARTADRVRVLEEQQPAPV